MTQAALNMFQRVMRQWDAAHPYNAVHVLQLAGPPDAAAYTAGFHGALRALRLGSVRIGRESYSFNISADTPGSQPPISLLPARELPPATTEHPRDLAEQVSRELEHRFAGSDYLPFRPFVLDCRAFHYVGLTYHHWVADAAAIQVLMREWFMRVHDPASATERPLRLARHGYWRFFGPTPQTWRLDEAIFSLLRRIGRYRRVARVERTATESMTSKALVRQAPAGLLDALRRQSRTRGVKLGDIFLAAVAAAALRHVPLERRRNRSGLAVGTIVDLRSHTPANLSETFGVFLGFASHILAVDQIRSFESLLRAISRQSDLMRRQNLTRASLLWLLGDLAMQRLHPRRDLYRFYRKRLPLAGGLSSVNMSGSWVSRFHPAPLQSYLRIAPTGPILPATFAVTSLGRQLELALTYRHPLIDDQRATCLLEAFLAALQDFAS